MARIKRTTVAEIENMKPGAARIEKPDTDQPGLYIIVQPSGKKSFAYRYRFADKPRKLTLGPVVFSRDGGDLEGKTAPKLSEGHTLAEARNRVRKLADRLRAGTDPAEELEQGYFSKPSSNATLSDDLDEYLKSYVRRKNRASTANGVEGIINNHVKPAIGSKFARRITKRDLVKLIAHVEANAGPAASLRTLSVVKRFFAWCEEKAIIADNPATTVKADAEPVMSDHYLNSDEIRIVMLAAKRMDYPYGVYFQTLILTAQRRTEVSDMVRGEIDGDVWTVPAERAKSKRPNPVPISPAVAKLLAECPEWGGSRYLFSFNGDNPIRAFNKAKKDLDAIVAELAEQEHVTVRPWRLHDLRRTFNTLALDLDMTTEDVADAILGHKRGGRVQQTYNKAKLINQRRAALETWSTYVTELVSPTPRLALVSA
ncbi:integrase [Rhizobium wenxiniae]|uniref:Integrase n=1 Tax=Rhizobium wenxiniae TaxID=1737357 RepID=A0A7X0CYN6_9HYPH|nr:site-specific integrase [Rhizobium wenxiniae]MBB6161068.1 integrase [Rhizobium wenxiniae]GGF86100.1 integrase [Rhizobium wenxiniae]